MQWHSSVDRLLRGSITEVRRLSAVVACSADLVLPGSAIYRHSPAPSLGHSGVGSTQKAAIQFAMLNVASSAVRNVHEAVVQVLKIPPIIQRLQRDVKVEFE